MGHRPYAQLGLEAIKLPVPRTLSYTYNTVIMQNTDRKWHIGTQTNGSGMEIFDGTARWYQDHGSSTQ